MRGLIKKKNKKIYIKGFSNNQYLLKKDIWFYDILLESLICTFIKAGKKSLIQKVLYNIFFLCKQYNVNSFYFFSVFFLRFKNPFRLKIIYKRYSLKEKKQLVKQQKEKEIQNVFGLTKNISFAQKYFFHILKVLLTTKKNKQKFFLRLYKEILYLVFNEKKSLLKQHRIKEFELLNEYSKYRLIRKKKTTQHYRWNKKK
jgi:hypothetical protein